MYRCLFSSLLGRHPALPSDLRETLSVANMVDFARRFTPAVLTAKALLEPKAIAVPDISELFWAIQEPSFAALPFSSGVDGSMQRHEDRLAFLANDVRRIVVVLFVRLHHVENCSQRRPE